MRIALIPLDNRPPNFQFPARLGAIAGIEVRLPPIGMLGSLHTAADGLALAHWLRDQCALDAPAGGCDAAVFSWDALLYGGLVQSRRLDTEVTAWDELHKSLAEIDWGRVVGYSYLTVPRLGITVDKLRAARLHASVRDYFIAWGRAQDDSQAKPNLARLEHELGEEIIARLWEWRERNALVARDALAVSAELGMHHCHVAVEDNAQHGPHLLEVERLRKYALGLKRKHREFNATFFDGADECACLLVSRALVEMRNLTPLQVQLNILPHMPGPERYTGLYESQSLSAGLELLAQWLRLDYVYDADLQWLVNYGVQPQPDAFSSDPSKIFNNPYLLPKELSGHGPLFVSDLAACNGSNPSLMPHLTRLAPGRLAGYVGFNTNFNTLGLSASWLRIAALPTAHLADSRRFLLERLADDVAYQSLARPQLLQYINRQMRDPMDFSGLNKFQQTECLSIVGEAWKDWRAQVGQTALSAAGIRQAAVESVRFAFPWQRAFEVQVESKR